MKFQPEIDQGMEMAMKNKMIEGNSYNLVFDNVGSERCREEREGATEALVKGQLK